MMKYYKIRTQIYYGYIRKDKLGLLEYYSKRGWFGIPEYTLICKSLNGVPIYEIKEISEEEMNGVIMLKELSR